MDPIGGSHQFSGAFFSSFREVGRPPPTSILALVIDPSYLARHKAVQASIPALDEINAEGGLKLQRPSNIEWANVGKYVSVPWRIWVIYRKITWKQHQSIKD